MVGRNTNVYFQESTYHRLRQITGGKISKFVNEAVEEKIKHVEQQKKTEFQQKLVADYQSVAKNKKLQQEVDLWDETLNDAWKKDE